MYPKYGQYNKIAVNTSAAGMGALTVKYKGKGKYRGYSEHLRGQLRARQYC